MPRWPAIITQMMIGAISRDSMTPTSFAIKGSEIASLVRDFRFWQVFWQPRPRYLIAQHGAHFGAG